MEPTRSEIEFLALWEEANRRGRDLDPADYFPDQPGVVSQIRQRIATMSRVSGDEPHSQSSSDLPAVDVSYVELNSLEHGFLSKWEEAYRKGEELDPSAYFPREPDLVAKLQRRIRDLKRFHQQLASVSQDGHAVARTITIPGYEILETLGSGGQADVYLARKISIDRLFAIKLLRAGRRATPAQMERFEREARVLAGLHHPDIVAVVDFGRTAEGECFLVMNYVIGDALDHFARTRNLSASWEGLRRGLQIFVRICEAVGAAHASGVIHRDLKPSNIRVNDDGHPLVLDFGLATMLGDSMVTAGNLNLTQTGTFLGTLAWASPEQARCEIDSLDSRTDVYSLGVMLYQLAADWRFPYEVKGAPSEVIRNICSVEPSPLKKQLEWAARHRQRLDRQADGRPAEFDPDLEAIVLKAISKRKEDRYADAGDLARELSAYLEYKTPRAVGEIAWRRLRRAIPRAIAIALMLVVCVAGAYVSYHQFWASSDKRSQGAAGGEEDAAAGGRGDQQGTEGRPRSSDQRQSVIEAGKTLIDLDNALDKLKEEAEDLKLFDPNQSRELVAETKARQDEITANLKVDQESLATDPEIEERMNVARTDVKFLTENVKQKIGEALVEWRDGQRRRSSVLNLPDAQRDARATAFDPVWVRFRDEQLQTLGTVPLLGEAKNVKNALENFAKALNEITEFLSPPPAFGHADIDDRAQTLWKQLIEKAAKALGDKAVAAEKVTQDIKNERYPEQLKDFQSTAQLKLSLAELIGKALKPAGLSEDDWKGLANAYEKAVAIQDQQPHISGLFLSLPEVRELLAAHEAESLQDLESLANGTATLECRLECSRRADEFTGDGREPTVDEIAAALRMHRGMLEALSSGKAIETSPSKPSPEQVAALFSDYEKRMPPLLDHWGRTQKDLPSLVELLSENDTLLPLHHKSLSWLRFCLRLHRLRIDGLPTDEPALFALRDELLSLAENVGSDWRVRFEGVLTPATLGPIGSPPPGERWKITWIDPARSQLLALWLAEERKALEFRRISTPQIPNCPQPPDFFVLTTELTIQDVIDIVGKAQCWGDLDQVCHKPNEKTSRPWMWSWDQKQGKIEPSEQGIPNLKSTVKLSPDYPFTHVTPAAAILIARQLGCRLPSTQEWLAAKQQAEKDAAGGKSMRPRLRGNAWTVQKASSLKSGIWLDEGIFMPRDLQAPSGAQSTVWDEKGLGNRFPALMNGKDDRDRSAIYRKCEGDANPGLLHPGLLHNVLGNVAELVLDEKILDPAPPEAMADLKAWVDRHAASFSVIGGSAMSPPQLDPTAPVALTKASGAVGYSDVGIRLVFDAKDVPLRRRMEQLLKSRPYLGPSMSTVPPATTREAAVPPAVSIEPNRMESTDAGNARGGTGGENNRRNQEQER